MTDIPQKAPDEKYSECGAIIKARAEICPKCGVRQLAPPNILTALAPNGKSKLAAQKSVGIWVVLMRADVTLPLGEGC